MWDSCMASATFDDYKAAAEITDSNFVMIK